MSVSYQAMRGLANVPWYFPFGGYDVVDFKEVTQLTASASIHTKGSWSEIFASTSDECAFAFFRFDTVAVSATETSMLVDIGVGAAGSEVAIMENLAIGGVSVSSGIAMGLPAPLPVRIPQGSRVSVRIQSLIASDTCYVRSALVKFPARQALPTSVDVLGTDTATSRGTALSGSSGSWTEIIASTAKRYRAVFAVPSLIGTDTATIENYLFEVGYGPAGSEVSVAKQRGRTTNSETVFLENTVPHLPIACDIPAGSRLAVKHNISANPDRYGVCVIGVPA